MPCQHVTELRTIPFNYQKYNRIDTFPMEKAVFPHDYIDHPAHIVLNTHRGS